MKAINNPFEPSWYTPAADRELPEGAIGASFKIRGLRSIEMFDVNAGAEFVNGKAKWTTRSARSAFGYCLLDWRGVVNEAGLPVPFDANDMESNISKLDFATLAELFRAIMDASSLNEDQRKN